jgi:hypothetical protein
VILFLISGFDKDSSAAGRKVFDEKFTPTSPETETHSPATKKTRFNTRRFELSERAIGPAVRYPPSPGRANVIDA